MNTGLIFTLLFGGFLIFYGLCVGLGWPIDVVRGIGLLERRGPWARAIIGVLLMAAGGLVLYFEFT